MVNGPRGNQVVRKRFAVGTRRLDKIQRNIGSTPRLRQRDGRGRMMRISEAERRAIKRSRMQERGLKAVRVKGFRRV